MALLSLAAAKLHLKIPAGDTVDDPELTAVVAEASDAIVVYLGPRAVVGWDETSTPPRIQAAVKLLLGYLWTARDDQEAAEKTWRAIQYWLERDRDPALA